jgi:Holliday junction resolvase RusA-like endonuclease
MIHIEIMGEPKRKERPRYGHGRAYTPDRTRKAERDLSWAVRQQISWPMRTLEGNVCVRLQFYCGTRRGKDLDNMIKLVLDACNGLLWQDDRQVTTILARVTRCDKNPRTIIAVESEDPRIGSTLID